MNIAQTAKQKTLAFIMLIAMVIGLTAPQKALAATPGNDLDDLKVTIDKEGKLNFSGGGMTYEDSGSAWGSFIAKYQGFIVGISGVGAVTMILFFIMQLLKLGGTAGNPQARSQVLTGLIWSGVAAAALGSVSVIVGFFYGALK